MTPIKIENIRIEFNFDVFPGDDIKYTTIFANIIDDTNIKEKIIGKSMLFLIPDVLEDGENLSNALDDMEYEWVLELFDEKNYNIFDSDIITNKILFVDSIIIDDQYDEKEISFHLIKSLHIFFDCLIIAYSPRPYLPKELNEMVNFQNADEIIDQEMFLKKQRETFAYCGFYRPNDNVNFIVLDNQFIPSFGRTTTEINK